MIGHNPQIDDLGHEGTSLILKNKIMLVIRNTPLKKRANHLDPLNEMRKLTQINGYGLKNIGLT